MAETAVSGGGETAPADDRAERDHVVPKPHVACAVPREHDRTETDVFRGLRDRRRGRRAFPWNAMAGNELLDDASLSPHAVRYVKLYSHAPRKAFLSERTCGSALPRRELR